jgi:hypothetical protein
MSSQFAVPFDFNVLVCSLVLSVAISFDPTDLSVRYILWFYWSLSSLYPLTLLTSQFTISFDPTDLSVRYILWPYWPLSPLYPLTLLASQFASSFDPTVPSGRYILWPYWSLSSLFPLILLSSQFGISFVPIVLSIRFILGPYWPLSSLHPVTLLSCHCAISFDPTVLSVRYILLSTRFATAADHAVLSVRYDLWPCCPLSSLLPHTLSLPPHVFHCYQLPPTYTRVVISSKNVDWYTIVLPQLDSSSITSYMRECFLYRGHSKLYQPESPARITNKLAV